MDSGLFGNGDLDDPKTQALLGTFLKMLEASGPSPVRRTFGSILGTAGQEGMKQYDQARVMRQRDEELRRRNLLTDMQIKKMQDALRQESIIEEAANAAYQSPMGEANQAAFDQTGLPLGLE